MGQAQHPVTGPSRNTPDAGRYERVKAPAGRPGKSEQVNDLVNHAGDLPPDHRDTGGSRTEPSIHAGFRPIRYRGQSGDIQGANRGQRSVPSTTIHQLKLPDTP